MMYDVKPLLLTILDSLDHNSALVLADWLAERGDEFADELRRPQVGPAIISVFRHWCNDFNFTPTLELLKDAAKMRNNDPIVDDIDEIRKNAQEQIEMARRWERELERWQVQLGIEREAIDSERRANIPRRWPTPSGELVPPIAVPDWTWRPEDGPRWYVNTTQTDGTS